MCPALFLQIWIKNDIENAAKVPTKNNPVVLNAVLNVKVQEMCRAIDHDWRGFKWHSCSSALSNIIFFNFFMNSKNNRIIAWLAHIDEIDQTVIDEALQRCRANQEVMQYFLKRSTEAL